MCSARLADYYLIMRGILVAGRGQIIRLTEQGVLWSGSDGRADGAAFGY